MSKLLIDDYPLMVSPKLAVLIGLEEAHFLQQLHWLCDRSKHEHDGFGWVYNTVNQWHVNHFPFISERSLSRIIKKLKGLGMIVTTNKYNKMKFDKTMWFRVDYDAVLLAVRDCQIGSTRLPDCHDGDCQTGDMDGASLAATIPETSLRPPLDNLVGEEKTEPANNVDSDEPTRSPRGAATENKKRFDGLAKVFNQVFAECNQVTKVSPQAKTINKKRIALVPQAWAFGRERVNHLAEQGLIPEANAPEVLAWFQRYFEICRDDPFINGTQPRGKGHENWKASFEYLMKITEIEKRILESE